MGVESGVRVSHPVRGRALAGLPVVAGFGRALGCGRFLCLVLALACGFAAAFLYIASAPAFVLDVLGQDETRFIWLFGPITAGLLLGARWASRCAGRWSNRRTIAVAYGTMALAVALNLGLHVGDVARLPWSVLPLTLYVVGSALAAPSLTVMALDLLPKNRGLAASCQGFFQTAANALVAALLAPLCWGGARDLSLGMMAVFAASVLALVAYRLLARRASVVD